MAVVAIVKSAVIWVELTTLILLTVSPLRDQVMPVTLMKLVPVKVTVTEVPLSLSR